MVYCPDQLNNTRLMLQHTAFFLWRRWKIVLATIVAALLVGEVWLA